MNDLLRKNKDQPTNNIDVSCVQTVGLLITLTSIHIHLFHALSFTIHILMVFK
jgi:hypothetical protein